jgi:hypothetical protein
MELEINKQIKANNKIEVRDLEAMYVNGKIDNLDKIVKDRKESLIKKIEYYQRQMKRKERDKKGKEIEALNVSPFVLQNYFFKSINPIGNKEPMYNAEKLSIVWDLYCEIVTEINMKIGDFMPNISSFCIFAGITTNTFKRYNKSVDGDMVTICEKINDYCFDSNITMAQRGVVSEKSTIYRMKIEEDRGEKVAPQIHLHSNDLNMDIVKDRLKELEEFNELKKNAIIAKKVENDG